MSSHQLYSIKTIELSNIKMCHSNYYNVIYNKLLIPICNKKDEMKFNYKFV